MILYFVQRLATVAGALTLMSVLVFLATPLHREAQAVG